MASAARPFSAIIDPDAFLEPGGMPGKIAQWCRKTGQEAPGRPEAMCRAILEGLALRYRQVLEKLESLTGTKLDVIHIVGGGSKNRVLNQFVADATARTVVAGPSEATAAGNVLVQAIGSGAVPDLEGARALVRNSFELETYLPGERGGWDAAYERFMELKR
jgi:sugar (pentulose or hexulose) kinase